ncbi:NIPSNAP family protein [Pollutimonas bauzanensis]|uniref:NIPSNAP protein n=1 Tax=Pollutimonas bauzanensis TaxID=658167 RepID=A0A1M5ZJ24_9BURK|nr:NIPSNAP family protein [Pollutimonas bauzanensis]SHI24141.1 NIPSNAP protein [Pollutimonas bauzanensis]
MIYELRIYHCAQGRLPALHRRFQDATLGLWDKHGIQAVGFWTTMVGPSNQTLTFMLQWRSLAERERIWEAFSADPEWVAARLRYEAEGPIVARIENQLLAPTDYSPLR